MNKLTVILKDAALAAKLIKAGLEYPTQICEASDALLASAGLDGDEIAAVRAKLPRR
jgi:hypothetical protein